MTAKVFPGNATQRAVCEELDRAVGVVGTAWLDDPACEEPVTVHTSTMGAWRVLPDGACEAVLGGHPR